jgi:hypothetical protein
MIQRAKTIERPASEARQEFLQLFEDVVTDAVEGVVITHRDFAEHAMLVSERRVRQLEQRITVAETRLKAQARIGFKLIGSGQLLGDPDVFLAELRATQKTLAAARVDSF